MHAIATTLSDDSPISTQSRARKRRVLIVSDHPTQSVRVTKNLRALDLDVQLSLFDGNTLNAMPTDSPDAVLCHLTDYVGQAESLVKVVRSHFNSANIPLIGALARPSDGKQNGFDSCLFAPVHASQIANRVNAMIRLGVMEGEIERRLNTLSVDFGVSPDIGSFSADRKFRVLFIGKASPSFMVIINALQDKGVDVIAAFTSFSAFDYLHGDPFDAVIMNALESTEPTFSISEAMRRNAKLFHTPTLFLVNGETFTDYEAAYERGARDIIDMHADSEEISGRILELANYHRVHEQMKLDFQKLSLDLTGDKTGTAYSQRFMRSHLPRMLEDARASNHPVSLLGIKLLMNSTDDVTKEATESACRQTADLIGNLIRMQDVLCRWSADEFVLAFYDTNEAETKTVLSRINALLECTVHETGSEYGGALSVSTQSKILELNSSSAGNSNTLVNLIANLRQNPDEH